METLELRADPLQSLILRLGFGALLVAFLTLASEGTAQEHGPRSSSDASPGAGSLRGSVTLGPKLTARRMRFTLYPDLSGAAPPGSRNAGEEIKNVVLYLGSPALNPTGQHPPAEPFQMEQKNESFQPHILPIVKGSTVVFPNGDPIYHNVFSLSKTASFDLGRYPRGASRSVRFDEPGVVKVFCHIHSDMSAVILVLDNPYFTTPDADGGFQFPELPSGTYTITAWHERARPIRREVQIRSGRATTMDFAIPLEDAPVGD
jgi:plastocyanin